MSGVPEREVGTIAQHAGETAFWRSGRAADELRYVVAALRAGVLSDVDDAWRS
jgi:hypothetical protein